jgi:hypothetical protein
MQLGRVMIEGEFEVFDSRGSWAFLLGKPLLRMFRATQAYWPDTVSIHGKDEEEETLVNELKKPQMTEDEQGMNLTLDVKQHDIVAGGSSKMKPPSREVLNSTTYDSAEIHTDEATCPVYVTSDSLKTPKTEPESILTQEKDPYKPERIQRIKQEVTIGPDVTDEQRQIILNTLEEYADCFTLSMKEVNTIPGAVHKLNIPSGATFRTKIPPRSYNPDQRTFVNTKVNEMLKAGIICPIHPSEV